MFTRNLDNMISDHPIWTEFKGTSVHFDRVIIFPAGAGGHFLMTQMDAVECMPGKFNEFKTDDWSLNNYFLDVDSHLATNGISEAVLDTWLHKLRDTEILPKYNTAYGHILPNFFCKIYNVTIGEMIYIDWDKCTSVLVCLLCSIKNKMHTNFDAKSYQIFELLRNLSRYKSPASIISALSPNSVNRLDLLTVDIRGDFLSANNAVSWEFLMHDANNNRPGSQVDKFKAYIEDSFGAYGKETIGATEWYENDKRHLPQFISEYGCKVIQYRDIFINRHIPIRSALDNIDFQKVKEYHLANLRLVKQLSKLFTSKGLKEIEYLLPNIGYEHAT